MFLTIEDETGVANVVIWPSLYQKHRRLILSCGTLSVRGRIQREGEVTHLVADAFDDLTPLLRSIGRRGREETTVKADVLVRARDFR
jgi:error-prone DNA polymerase